MTGFTRIHPLGEGATEKAKIFLSNPGWLPAIEVRGEGIFLELDRQALEEWENRTEVKVRAARVDQRLKDEWRERQGAGFRTATVNLGPLLLVHTFAHALMRQLTLDCGYSSTALRERLYVSEGDMRGILIYTATTDDDGTLGGTAEAGRPERIVRTIVAAVQSQAWCSSDPLCIEDMLVPEDGFVPSSLSLLCSLARDIL